MERQRGFTLREILIVVIVLALLAAIVLPVSVTARERGRSASCLSNVGQLTIATLIYSGANDDGFPEHQWLLKVEMARVVSRIEGRRGEVVKVSPLLSCPHYVDPWFPETPKESGGYGLNGCVRHVPALDAPANIVLIGETAAYEFIWRQNGRHYQNNPDWLLRPDDEEAAHGMEQRGETMAGPLGRWGARRHFERANYAFADGHARAVAPSAFYIPRGLPCGEIEKPVSTLPNGPRFASLPFGRNIVGNR